MIAHEVLSQVKMPRLRSKNDAYRLESGLGSITAQVEGLGLSVCVVGRDGVAYNPAEWPASRTFWQGAQENLLIADKQSASYELGDEQTRQILARYAWGGQASTAAGEPTGSGQLPVG
jgi:hypothetical protein